MFPPFPRNHIFRPRIELFHLLLAKKSKHEDSLEIERTWHCIHIMHPIHIMHNKCSDLRISYSYLVFSHQTQRLDLFLLCDQRLVMEQLCGEFAKMKAQLGLFMKTCKS